MNNQRVMINVFLTLFILWLMLNSALSFDIFFSGVFICALLAYFLAPMATKYGDIRFNSQVVYHYILYLGIFIVELVKANLQVAKIVISPKISITPGIVKVKTQLKTPIGRWVLANSISLTPGTLVVDLIEDTLFVHCIDVTKKNPEAETQQMTDKFEKYLKVVYG